MDKQILKAIVEGLLFMAGQEGLSVEQISEITSCPTDMVIKVLHELRLDLQRSQRGVQLLDFASMYKLATLPEHAVYFEKMACSPTRATLSQASLETLAIVAYRQPITRVEIEDIRGVKSDRALQTLINRNLIAEVGRAEAIGRPILYGTTKSFLDYFGLSCITDLPDATRFEQTDEVEDEAM